MRSRRGSSTWSSKALNACEIFKVGDIVHTVTNSGGSTFYGLVSDVNPVINKVAVMWNTGASSQHGPEDIVLALHVDDEIRNRLANMVEKRLDDAGTRRMAGKMVFSEELNVPHGENFAGNPETHGIDEPVKGGFSIMKELVQKLHKESIKDGGKIGGLVARRVASSDVAVPEKFIGRSDKSGIKFWLNMVGDKIKMTIEADGKKTKSEFSNDRQGWRNGVKKAIQVSMADNKAFDAWVKDNFPSAVVEKTASEKVAYPKRPDVPEFVEYYISPKETEDPESGIFGCDTGFCYNNNIGMDVEQEVRRMNERLQKNMKEDSGLVARMKKKKRFVPSGYHEAEKLMKTASCGCGNPECKCEGDCKCEKTAAQTPKCPECGSFSVVSVGANRDEGRCKKCGHQEIYEAFLKSKKKASELKSRRAMYHKQRGRFYKPTRAESETGILACPKCKADMKADSFSRGVKLYVCPSCGFKITSDKVV